MSVRDYETYRLRIYIHKPPLPEQNQYGILYWLQYSTGIGRKGLYLYNNKNSSLKQNNFRIGYF